MNTSQYETDWTAEIWEFWFIISGAQCRSIYSRTRLHIQRGHANCNLLFFPDGLRMYCGLCVKKPCKYYLWHHHVHDAIFVDSTWSIGCAGCTRLCDTCSTDLVSCLILQRLQWRLKSRQTNMVKERWAGKVHGRRGHLEDYWERNEPLWLRYIQ